jgi:hypothetical protein
MVRGYMAKKRVAHIRTANSVNSVALTINDKYQMYTNPGVTAIIEKVGPF